LKSKDKIYLLDGSLRQAGVISAAENESATGLGRPRTGPGSTPENCNVPTTHIRMNDSLRLFPDTDAFQVREGKGMKVSVSHGTDAFFHKNHEKCRNTPNKNLDLC